MAIANDVTVNVGSYVFRYNEADLRGELAAKNISASRIDEIINEISTGNLSTLRELGLVDHVTISFPGLDPAGNYNLDNMLESLGTMQSFDMLDAMMALFESGQALRKAAREGRLNEMENAKMEALNAADKIRSAAMFSLVFGCVSGAINVGMGVFGAVSSGKQLANMKSTCSQFKSANVEMKQVKSDLKLAEAQSNLKASRAQINEQQAKAEALETRFKAQNDVEAAKTKLSGLKEGTTDHTTAKNDLAAKEAALKDLKAKDGLGDGAITKADVDKAKTEVGETKAKIAELETKVKDLATTAEKNNLAQEKQIDKEIKDLKTEQKKLADKGDTEGAAKIGKEITALENKKADLVALREAYKDPTSDKATATADARGAKVAAQMEETTKPRFKDAQTKFNQLTTEIQTKAAHIQSLNSVGDGVGKIVQSVGNFISEGERADGAEDTARQQEANARMEDWADFQKSMGDLIQSAMDTLKQYCQTVNQLNSSIFQNM